jgi:hypothetical protein
MAAALHAGWKEVRDQLDLFPGVYVETSSDLPVLYVPTGAFILAFDDSRWIIYRMRGKKD